MSTTTSTNPLQLYLDTHAQDAAVWEMNNLLEEASSAKIDFLDAAEAIAQLIALFPKPIQRDQYITQASKLDKRLKKPLITKRVKEVIEEEQLKAVQAAIKAGGASSGIAIPKIAFTDGYNPEDDIETYGFYEQGHRYWKYVPYPGGGGEWKDFTNFTMKVLYHMDNGTIARRVVEMTNVHKRKIVVDTPTTSLTSKSEFMKFVESRGNFLFYGNDSDLARLKNKLYDSEGHCREISVLGWNEDGKFFSWSNGIYNGEFTSTDEYGFLTHGHVNYYIPSGNTTIPNRKKQFTNEIRFRHHERFVVKPNDENSGGATNVAPTTPDPTFEYWAQKYCKVFGDNGNIILLFAISCLYSDVIFNRKGSFPLLFLYGEGGSGKGSAVKMAQYLFGHPQDPLTLSGKANTDKAKIRNMAQFVNIMLLLEEYVNGNHDLDQMLKNIQDRYGYKRAKMDMGYGTESVSISSGVAVTGNYAPTDDPLIQRLIFLVQNKNEFSDDEKKLFKELKNFSEEGITNITHELLNFRGAIEENFDLKSKQCYKEIYLACMGAGTDRMIENINMLYTVFTILREAGLIFPFTPEQLKSHLSYIIGVQNEKRNLGSEVQTWWDIIVTLINEGKLIHQRDFKINGNLLYLRFKEMHGAYMEAHARINRASGLRSTTMIDKLKHSPSFEGDKGTRFSDRNTNSFIFDLNKLKDTGVDIFDAVQNFESFKQKDEAGKYGTLNTTLPPKRDQKAETAGEGGSTGTQGKVFKEAEITTDDSPPVKITPDKNTETPPPPDDDTPF